MKILARLVAGLALVGACHGGGNPDGGHDAAAALADLPPAGLNLTGRYATLLSLTLGVSAADGGLPGDGGSGSSSFTLPVLWVALQQPGKTNVEVDTSWQLCDVSFPGWVDVGFKELNALKLLDTRGQLASTDGPSAAFTQPELGFVLGARLADPLHDPLPTDGSKLCSDTVSSGCAVPEEITGKPGVSIVVSGFHPDIDLLYLDLRATFALAGTAHADGTISGTVSSTGIDAHVLACRLRGGAGCAPSDVARLEAQHPRYTLSGGTFRSHVQGPYFTCPQLNDDPLGSVNGVELPDGGVSDLGHASTSPATFSAHIQRDLDERGCATGGCHDVIHGPGRLSLIFQPTSDDERRTNYRAVLPFAGGARPGGRLVNQTPLPPDMRARWLDWIARGMPY